MPKPLLALARDLIRAESPVPYAPTRATFAARSSVNAGFTTALEAYGAVPQLQALISRWAQDAAQVTWHLYVKRRPGEDPNEPRREVTMHAAWDLWCTPNPWMTQQHFLEASIQHLLITGESDWCIARAGKLPIELWLARPDRMVPVPHREKFLAGWVYEAHSEKVPLDPGDVVQVMIPNPSDPYRGLSPIQALLPTLQAADSATKWWLNFFRNGAAPGGALMVEKNLGDEEFDRLTRQWQTQHKGVQNAHRVAILEAGMHYESTVPTMKDMQFTELLSLPNELIRGAFTFPKPLLGAVDDVNRANAEAGAVVYGRYHLATVLDRYRDAWNTKVLPQFGATARGLEIDFESPIPEDAAHELAELAARTQAYGQLLTAGVDPEDAATAVGLPPMRLRAITTDPAPETPEPGDDPNTLNLVKAAASLTPAVGKVVTYEEGRGWLNQLGASLDLTAEAPAPPAPIAPRVPPAHPEPDGDENTEGQEPPGPEEPTPTNRGPVMVVEPPPLPHQGQAPTGPPTGEEADLDSHQADWEAALAALVAAWMVTRKSQIHSLITQIRLAITRWDLPSLGGLHAGDHGGVEHITDAVTRLWVKTAAAETNQLHGHGFTDVTAPPVPEWVGTRARLAADLLTRDLEQSAAREAARVAPMVAPAPDDAAKVADDVAAQVEQHLNDLTDAGPTTQLGGVLTQTQGEARLLVMDQGPSPAYFASAHNDDRVCPNCASVDDKWLGNTIPEVQAVFPNGQYRACLGGSRCRCAVTATYRGGSDRSQWYEKRKVQVP